MRIAFALGDAAGVSPELAARILVDPAIEAGEMVVTGDARVLERGCAHAGVELNLPRVTVDGLRDPPDGTVLLDMANCDPDDVPLGVASEPGGRGSVQNFRMALEIANAGIADMVFSRPSTSMRCVWRSLTMSMRSALSTGRSAQPRQGANSMSSTKSGMRV